MNDITALMATMKAAAEKATEAHERLSAIPSDGLVDASLAENAQLESDITALIAHNDASSPANVLALVEALEARDKQIADSESRVSRQNRHVCELFDDNTALRQRIAELEVESKTMLELKQASLADNALLKLELEILESRTVTVKLPEVRITVAESKLRNLTYQQLDAYNAGATRAAVKLSQALAAAGIQVSEGGA